MAQRARAPSAETATTTTLTVHPNATEICNGVDNNCNGQADNVDPLATAWCGDLAQRARQRGELQRYGVRVRHMHGAVRGLQHDVCGRVRDQHGNRSTQLRRVRVRVRRGAHVHCGAMQHGDAGCAQDLRKRRNHVRANEHGRREVLGRERWRDAWQRRGARQRDARVCGCVYRRFVGGARRLRVRGARKWHGCVLGARAHDGAGGPGDASQRRADGTGFGDDVVRLTQPAVSRARLAFSTTAAFTTRSTSRSMERMRVHCTGRELYAGAERRERRPSWTVAPLVSLSPAIGCGVSATATIACWVGTAPVLTGVAEVAGTPGSGCARMTDGTVQCWGDNSVGELGDGTTTTRATAAPVTGVTGSVGIAMTAYTNACSLAATGAVKCCGSL